MEAKLLIHCEDQIGEGIFWHKKQEKLLWLDIDGCMLHEYAFHTKVLTDHPFTDKVTTIIPREGYDDEVVLALKDKIICYHLQNKTFRELLDIPSIKQDYRTNDGKASPEGRIWIGVMHMNTQHENGALYCIEQDLSFREILTGQSIPNGIVWNSRGDVMYYADSGKKCIYAFDYDRKNGSLSSQRVAIRVPPEYGIPDGMTIDADDHLWVAHWGGFGVYIWDPSDGRMTGKVEVPAPNVASCTFGDKNQLFITTARSGLSERELEQYPLSGSVFAAETPVRPGKNHYPFVSK